MIYDTPRWVGTPDQMLVPTQAQFWKFVEMFNGQGPCFTSHNAHPQKGIVLHRYVPFDFDGKDKIENTLADALALRDWAKGAGIQTLHVWTGGKGFHSYLVFAPREIVNDQGLKGVYKVLQRKAIDEAKLRTADRSIVGDVRRILRIVGCEYVNTKSGERPGQFTTEIPTDMLERADLDEIREYAKMRRPMIVQPEPTEALPQAVERLDLKSYHEHVRLEDRTAPTIAYNGSSPEFVKALLPRPCVHQGIMAHNPAHVIRFEAARHLIQVGLGVDGATSFLMDVAEQAGWVDRNESRTRYHVENISRHTYTPMSCTKIRASGLCVGSACDRFAREFPEDFR